MMQYAVVQLESEAPGVERLRRLYQAVPGVTDEDAGRMAADYYGILWRDLPLDQANLFQQACAAEGLRTRVVPEASLPVLPKATLLNRIELSQFALGIFDPLGRPTPVDWKNITLIAAGQVEPQKPVATLLRPASKLTDTLQWIKQSHTIQWIKQSIVPGKDARPAEPQSPREILELVVSGVQHRYTIVPKEFMFGYLFKHPELSVTGKLALLVEMLSEHAPHAALNRGAIALKTARAFGSIYSTQVAFEEECVWLLHRKLEAAASVPAAASQAA